MVFINCLICKKPIRFVKNQRTAGNQSSWPLIRRECMSVGIDISEDSKICVACVTNLNMLQKRTGSADIGHVIGNAKRRRTGTRFGSANRVNCAVTSDNPLPSNDMELEFNESRESYEDIGSNINPALNDQVVLQSTATQTSGNDTDLPIQGSGNSANVRPVSAPASMVNASTMTIEAVERPQSVSCSSSDSQAMTSSQVSQVSMLSSASQESIFSGILSTSKTQRNCVICRSPSGRSRIPQSAIHHAWLKKQILIPDGNRTCKAHLEYGRFTPEALMELQPTKDWIEITNSEMVEWVKVLTDSASRKQLIDFDLSSDLSSEEYDLLTGLPRKNFDSVFEVCRPYLKNSANRSPRNALAIFFMKMRLDVSQKVLAFLFGIDCQSRVSDIIHTVTSVLDEHFVPLYLGFSHLTRDQALSHVPEFVRKILERHPGCLILILDGTYVYIEKPTDFDLQKLTYSMQKLRNLIKPMMIILPDGYILHAEGPYFADGHNNDAGILKVLLREDGLDSVLNKEDVMVVDRGFERALNDAQEKGFVTFMPKFMDRKEKQFSTLDANETRRVTAIRWTVESSNGRIKNCFSFFDHTVKASYMPILPSFFRIVCAVQNAFSPPLFTESEKHEIILDNVLNKMKSSNRLKKQIEKLNLEKKRTVWKEADAESFPTFPKLALEDLFQITLGSYQIKNAKLYAEQHIRQYGCYRIFVHKDRKNLLRAQIQSRFSRKKIHQLWIHFKPKHEGLNSVVSWYCKCRVGARTVGCCSHITSVLWYLGYHRHSGKTLRQPRTLRFVNALIDESPGSDEEDEATVDANDAELENDEEVDTDLVEDIEGEEEDE